MKWSVPNRIGRFQICPRVAKELEACRMVKWAVPISIGRFQICPRIAKELEAGRAVTAIITFAQAMKRRFSYIKRMLVIECIWRLPGFKQAPELLDVPGACGFVYGCHRVRP